LVQLQTEAIVCALRGHGEHGTIVRLLTPREGLVAAYVRGGRGRQMRPVLIRGNSVSASLRSRTEAQLPQAEIELVHSRAPILAEPLPAAAIEWVTSVVTTLLPERQPYGRIYAALSALLDAVEAAPSALGWSKGLVRFEILLLAETGYAREADGPAEAPADWSGILSSLESSTDPLLQDLPPARRDSLHDSRARLLDRLKRAAG
jgi:DNA repair protein RecO (recombination protein O)